MTVGTALSRHTTRTLNLVDTPVQLDWFGGDSADERSKPEVQFREILSRSLDIGDLLETFFKHITPRLAYDGFAYSHSTLALDYTYGDQRGHKMEYRLVLGEEELGYLTVYRGRIFNTKNVTFFEEQLCALIYPLRNATLYQAALKSAYRDPLTGVDNRAALESRLPREICLAQRYRTPTSLMVLDVDRFKTINDTYGHRVGDMVLRRFVEIFEDVLRTTDLVYRYGGDEFVVLLSNTDVKAAEFVAERIRENVEECKVTVGNVHLMLTTSVGVTQLVTSDSPETVFQRADEALLAAKRHGRNQVVLV